MTKYTTLNKEKKMKRGFIIIALAAVMVFAFAGAAMADHSPQFYFNYQAGAGVTLSPTFQAVFPVAAGLTYDIDNGPFGTGGPHKTYSQTTAKCGVCHSVHRAPTLGTASVLSGPTTSSRYTLSGYVAQNIDTQLLLRSNANGSCIYCHVISGPHQMYGGWADLRWVSSTAPGSNITDPDQAADATWNAEKSWNEFYGHTTGCVSCHAVHGAYTLPESKILKYQGVKASSGFALKVQPEVYNNSPLYVNYAGMVNGTLKSDAINDGVTLEDAAVTANCSICHANYSPDNNTVINNDLQNLQLFQGGAWLNANGSTSPWVYGVSAGTWGNTFSMKYKNHPMKNADALFTSPGATGNATDGSVSIADSYVCQSCHDSPEAVQDGTYVIQSWPHYTPGYYKFMAAQNQAAFDTPATKHDVDLGRIPFYEDVPSGKPAIMNDGYCVKCHTTVGVDF